MQKTGVASLPLHPGEAPRWLFQRMVTLSKGIIEVIIYEYGTDELLRRLSDPFWFQAFSCVLGYDWHSSGTTTVTCGALKEAINSGDFGVMICGGKGAASRKTPIEIESGSKKYNLSTVVVDRFQYCSRMAAKVDNSAIQDGHNLYHHVFLFSEKKRWAVIQQGMNKETKYARRYHWLSEEIKSFVYEPHNAIVGEDQHQNVLDMTAKQSMITQKVSVDLVNDHPSHLRQDWAMLTRHEMQRTLDDCVSPTMNNYSLSLLAMPRTINWNKMKEIYDIHPTNYEELLALKGVGSNTVRALALISDLIYNEKPSWKDPVRFSFTVGGKDGVPYPVDCKAMDESISIIRTCVEQAKIGEKQKILALRRLKEFLPRYST